MYLFLPGNNKENKQWCDELKDSFKAKNNLMLYYNHWDSEGNIDWDTELNKIVGLKIKEKTYVIAKSTGCILGLKAQKLGYIDVEKYIFIGFPYYWAKQRGDEVDYLLENLNTNTLIIQKSKDPVIGYDELETIIKTKGLNNIEMLLYERNNEPNDIHHYADIKYLNSIVEEYISS